MMRILLLLSLLCAGCASTVKDYNYRPASTQAGAKEAAQLKVKANMQFFMYNEAGKRLPMLAETLVFDRTALQLFGHQYHKHRILGAVGEPAKLMVDYRSISNIELIKKRDSYRIFLLDGKGKELLCAVSTSREAMWLFVDSLISYGALEPRIVNGG